MIVRKYWKYALFLPVFWVISGCGEAPAPVAPKEVVGPTTDPAGEAFSKPSKPAGSRVAK